MSEEGLDGAKIKGLGWRQGSVLPEGLVQSLRTSELLPQAVEGGELWIVLSHSCDVVNPSFANEPSVELIRMSRLGGQEPDGALQWFKNPRVCQLHETVAGTAGGWQISIHERATVPRRLLLDYQPDEGKALQQETIRRIALWCARRYTRAPFPDEFNRRCSPAKNRLKPKLKSRGGLLTGIYLLVEDLELDEGSAYEMIIIGSMLDEAYRAPGTRAQGQELLDAIEAAFAECDGVNVLESALRSEADISLQDLRQLKRWDWDYLSLRSESATALPPSG